MYIHVISTIQRSEILSDHSKISSDSCVIYQDGHVDVFDMGFLLLTITLAYAHTFKKAHGKQFTITTYIGVSFD